MVKLIQAPGNPPTLGSALGDDSYEAQVEHYKRDLAQWCRENSRCKHAGEIIRFPVADGHAEYMVIKYSEIIFLPLYDEYQIPEAHVRGLMKADILALLLAQ